MNRRLLLPYTPISRHGSNGVESFISSLQSLFSSIVLWHCSAARSIALPLLIGLGALCDALTSIIYIGCMVTRRHSSGFLGVGFVCYLWAWLSFPAALLLPSDSGLFLLWCRKSLDIALLALLYASYYGVFWLVGRPAFDGSSHSSPSIGR